MGKRKTVAAPWMRLAVAAWLLAWATAGCGIKGPPSPLRQRPVPRVTDLVAQVTDRKVVLTWSLTAPLSSKQARQAVFSIYQSRTPRPEAACEGCPRVFEKIGSVGYVDRDDDRYTTSVPMRAGEDYRFKVKLDTAGGPGAESDTVRVDGFDPDPENDSEAP